MFDLCEGQILWKSIPHSLREVGPTSRPARKRRDPEGVWKGIYLYPAMQGPLLVSEMK